MEYVESVFILIQFHLVQGLFELVALLLDHLLSFFYFLLFVLELFDLFIDLLLHHLE